MIPVVLNTEALVIALVGNGKACERRLKLLDEAKAQVKVYSKEPTPELEELAGKRLVRTLPSEADFATFHVMMIVDLEREVAEALATIGRKARIIVNIEDNKPFCDFYFSSVVRRGDLVIGINTGGKSPALTVRIRKYLEKLFPAAWKQHLSELAMQRLAWRAEGATFPEVIQKSNDYIDAKGWLPKQEDSGAPEDVEGVS